MDTKSAADNTGPASIMNSSTPVVDIANGNTTAIEAISERLSGVTALAEQLDRALTAARLDPTAPPPPPSVEDVTDVPGDAPDTGSTMNADAEPQAVTEDAVDSQAERSDATTTEEWRSALDLADSDASVREVSSSGSLIRGRQQAEPQAAVVDRVASESEDFITASECTCTPPSRSSSFHTASEGGVTSPWWELDPTSEEGDDDVAAQRLAAQRPSPSRVSKQVQTLPIDADMQSPVPAAGANTTVAEVKTVVQHHVHHLPDTEIHSASCDEGEREVLVGVLTQREVRETRQLRIRRGGGETRAESELSCSRIEAQRINGPSECNASTSSNTSATSTLSSGTLGALDSVLQVGQDDVDAAYRQQLEESLPLPLPLPLDIDLDLQLPSPLAFADPPAEYAPEYASEYDEHLAEAELESLPPPPSQELLDGLKEVSLRDENANHVVLLESVLEPPLPPPPPLQQSSRFIPHIVRHAIKGVF